MDSLLFHPKVVHLPIALSVVLPFVAGGLLLAWWRDWLPRRAWAVVVALQVMLAVSGFVALRTGEAEEERVEEVVPERHIEAHEEAAQAFMVGAAFVLLLAVGALAVRPERPAKLLAAAATVGTLAVLGLGFQVGAAGGELVYRHGAAAAYTRGGGTGGEGAATEAGGGEREGGGWLGGEEEDDDD